MDMSILFALSLASAINAGIPGPCMLFTVARTARSGAPAGLSVSAGILVGDGILVIAAVSVLLGLLTLPEDVLHGFKWLSATVLIILSFKLLGDKAEPTSPSPRCSARLSDWLSGFALCISSPFNLIFYLALLPQFVPSTPATISTGTTLTAALLVGVILAQAAAVLVGMGALKFPGRGVFQPILAVLMIAFAINGVLTSIG